MELPARVLTMITGVTGLHLGEFPGEQRFMPRVRVGRRGNIARLTDGKPTSVAVMVRDVSATGVGLVHTEPVALGQEFVLFIPIAKERTGEDAVVLQCRCVRCTRSSAGGAYAIGATVLQILRPKAAAGDN